jgi:hypothetical protein
MFGIVQGPPGTGRTYIAVETVIVVVPAAVGRWI